MKQLYFVSTNQYTEMPLPVVILAFSNDIDNPLSSLKYESRNINQALSPLEDRRMLKLLREEKSTTEDLIELLLRLENPENNYELAIFHYGGHADGDSIQLEDGKGHAEGLAALLGRLKNSIKLVFLNGCSTRQQVDKLLKQGIQAVIATSAPIGDDQASQFSELFYRKLASRSTIEQAFDFASAGIMLKFGHTPNKIASDANRGLDIDADDSIKDFPWALYYRADSSSVLDWYFVQVEEPSIARPFAGNQTRTNDYLLDVAWAMGNHKTEIQEAIRNNTLSEGEQYELIIKNFPWLLSTHIRVLLSSTPSMAAPSLERLEQIISTYIAAGQLIYFILLSNLWDQKWKNNIQHITLAWHEFVAYNIDNLKRFDYLSHAKQIISEINTNTNAVLFIPEMDDINTAFDNKTEFYTAYLYLESIKDKLLQKKEGIAIQDIPATCFDSEYALSVVLSLFAFLVKYQMVTVRDVKVSKMRYHPPDYKHFIGKLNAHMESSIIVSDIPKSFAEYYIDDRSVVLIKDMDNPNPFLNLTPFVIDRNAYGDKKDSASNLFNLAYCGPCKEDLSQQFFYLMSSKSPLNYDFFNPNEAHVLHTGQKKQVDPTNRRPVYRNVEELSPYDVLKTQLTQFEEDWKT